MRFDFHRFDFVELEHQADVLAVIDPQGESLSWKALWDATQGWMTAAQEAGVRPGVPLQIVGHKEPGFIVAMLGCLCLNVPFVPADTINPKQRIDRIAELVRAGLRFDASSNEFQATGAESAPLAEPDLAYIMFTSGSTGEPKGVQIGRESVTLFSTWIRDCLALGDAPVFMDQMLFNFDFSLFNWVGALSTGGVCVLCPRSIIAQQDHFLDYLGRSKISVFASTPSFVRQLLLAPAFSHQALPELAVFVFGAESLTPALAQALWTRFPQVRIINSYGPTEATCSTTWVEIDAALREASPNPFPIGRAKPYAHVFLDDGEICMAGDHVMRGYLNRPELNEAHLFEHNGKRAYRSGDVGEIDAQGLVTFRGRRDDQIKLHGYRIELAEIDIALSKLPHTQNAASFALRRPDGAIVRIVGIIEPDSSGEPGLHPVPAELSDWKEQLGQMLPHYMIPSELLVCYRLPLTSSDKTDRKQLQHLYMQRLQTLKES